MSHLWTKTITARIEINLARVSSSWLKDKMQSYRDEKKRLQVSLYTIVSATFSLVWFIQKMILKISLSLRVWIVKGLLVKSNWFWGTNSLKNDLFIFKGWYAKGKWLTSYACIWFFDRGKLVIRCHSQVTKVLRRTRNRLGKLTTFSVVTSSFKQIFKTS